MRRAPARRTPTAGAAAPPCVPAFCRGAPANLRFRDPAPPTAPGAVGCTDLRAPHAMPGGACARNTPRVRSAEPWHLRVRGLTSSCAARLVDTRLCRPGIEQRHGTLSSRSIDSLRSRNLEGTRRRLDLPSGERARVPGTQHISRGQTKCLHRQRARTDALAVPPPSLTGRLLRMRENGRGQATAPAVDLRREARTPAGHLLQILGYRRHERTQQVLAVQLELLRFLDHELQLGGGPVSDEAARPRRRRRRRRSWTCPPPPPPPHGRHQQISSWAGQSFLTCGMMMMM